MSLTGTETWPAAGALALIKYGLSSTVEVVVMSGLLEPRSVSLPSGLRGLVKWISFHI
jgi:hypothetical protein